MKIRPYILLNLFGLSEEGVTEALQTVEKHKDLDGVYVGGGVSVVSEELKRLITKLAELVPQAYLVLNAKTSEALESLRLLAESLQNVEIVTIVNDLNVLRSVELGRLQVGFEVLNPYPNLGKLAALGIKYLAIPSALIRSRVVREAEARDVKIIALNVNSPENYLKSKSLKVFAVVTEKPTIRREAEDIGF